MAADGSIIFEANLDDRQAQTKLNQLKSKIQRLQSSLEKSTGEQSGIKDKLDSAKASAQQTEKEIKRIMAALQSELALNEDVQSGKISMSAEELQQAAERQDDLLLKLKEQQDILKQQDQEIQSLGRQYDRVTEKISRQTQELNDAKNEASDYARQVIEAGKSQNVMAEVTQKTSAIMAQLGEKIKAIAKRALIFSVIASAIKALKDILGRAIAQNKEAAAAVSQLKAALLTLAQPIIETVLPAFTAFVNVLSKVVTAVAKFVSLLFGKSFSQTKKNAQSLNSQAGAIENVGGAAKEASKYLADFDELNVMNDQSDDQTGGGFGGFDSGEIAPDFSKLDADVSIFDNLLARLQKIWQDIKNIFLDLKDIVVDFFSGDWGDMLEKINLLFWHIQDLVSDVLMFVSEAFGDIIDWIVEKLHLSGTPIGQALEGIKEIVQGAIELIVNFLNLNLDGVLASIEKMLKGVQDLVFGIGDFLQNGINNLLDWFDEKTGGALHDLVELVRATVNNIFEFVDDIVGSILLGVKDMLNGIITFLNGVFSGNWKQAWEGLMQFVKGIGTTIAGIFASVINVIIRALNWMISQINRISIKIPDWVPGIGGRTYGPNIPTIAEVPVPHLAEGAVIPPNREFMAVLGDQKSGTNIEAPLSTIQEAVAQAFTEMAPAFALAIVQAFAASGTIGNIRAIEEYTKATAQKDFTLGKPNSTTGRWVSQALEAYEVVRG